MKSLSSRLLWLTILFVMIAEVLIWAPSIARFRKVWFEERLNAAHMASLALEATPDYMVSEELERRLLGQAYVLGMDLYRPDGTVLMLGPNMPVAFDATYDLREISFFEWVTQAFATMTRGGNRVLRVIGHSQREDQPLIEAFVNERPLRNEMYDFSGRILALSLFISGLTAMAVFATLHRQIVRPMRRLTRAMVDFRAAPEDARRRFAPSGRQDEIGVAERALAEMEDDLRAALKQKERLAALGSAVTKIHHDLRGILSSAMVVSDRLEESADPDVRRITPTVINSLDRAVALCTRTMDFVREGPPVVAPSRFALAALVDEVGSSVTAAGNKPVAWENAVSRQMVIRADRDLLFRTLENLGRNAAEAGATRVLVEAAPRRNQVAILVRDDGPGLPPKAQENLFKPFSGSGRAGGTGLGLSIARELTQAQGGFLRLAETGPRGTAFELTLPDSVGDGRDLG